MLVSKFDNKLKNDGYNVSQWRPEMRRRNFFLQHNSFKDAKRHLISFVFVREPGGEQQKPWIPCSFCLLPVVNTSQGPQQAESLHPPGF